MQWVGRYIPLADAPQTGTLPGQTPILHGDTPPGQTPPRQKPLGRPPSVDPPLIRQLKWAACTPLERSLVFFLLNLLSLNTDLYYKALKPDTQLPSLPASAKKVSM